jgi:glutathione S-transferase
MPKITLYTAHLCPWAHRSQIALRELGLEFETVLVNLDVPRTPEYLAINPRGLVPALVYDGRILIESGLIAQFLVDTHPSHLLKANSEPGGALQRYEIGFFVDTYFGKVAPSWNAAVNASAEEKEAAATKFTDAVVKEIEPLLSDAAPFFGGSSRLTLAEVCNPWGRPDSMLILFVAGTNWIIHPSRPLIPQI